jgi:c-di-GMP-binding flagellar brake protein YcgR
MASPEEHPGQLRANEGAATAETVLDPPRIAGLLRAITFPPLLINVALPGVRDLFASALLEVDAIGRRILLDGLSPENGHALIEPGSIMHMHAKLRGVQIDFATQVIEIQSAEHMPAYLARMPGSVRYHQRRRHFRLRAGQLQDYSILKLGSEVGGLSGRLLDLSAGGLKGVFPHDSGLAPGKVIGSCSLSILGQEQLECGIELIHMQVLPLTGEIEAGARFLDTDARGTERLQRLLTKLQREYLRQRIPE